MRETLQKEIEVAEKDYVPPLIFRTRPVLRINRDQFYKICRLNGDLRLELTAEGDVIVMAPTSIWVGGANTELSIDFGIWARADGSGRVFGPDTGYTLPNGAVRVPDVSWILNERLARLTREEGKKFARICPDFVLELCSSSDRVPDLKKKMAEYLDCGARLGWLINPPRKEVFVYRPGRPVEHLINPPTLSGETVLPGFVLDLARFWPLLVD